jgi:CheY-like chemotaxis protein
MTDLNLVELRERFRESSRKRLEEMLPLLDAVDAESMRKLARHFHAFAGLGTTYGFPRISFLGDEGESSILPLVRCGEEPNGATIARWRELCADIERALEDVREPIADGAPAMHVEAVPPAIEPRRILAVEDDEAQGVLLAYILAAAGYEVAICSDPEQFEATLAGFAPDLLLTDIQLADDDRGGYDLVRRMREDTRFQALPVIFVSADDDSDAVDGDPLVPKPVDWSLLLSLIQSRLQ